MGKQVEYNGKLYNSKKELIEEMGYNYQSVMKATSRYNISVVEYLKWVEEGRFTPRSFTYQGVKYKSMKECVEKLLPDMTIEQFTSRKNYLKISIVECLDRTLNGEFDSRFEINGVKYTSVQECIEAHGYHYNEVYNVYRNRKLYKDMSIYEFLEKYFNGEIPHKLDRVEYDNKTYKSFKDLLNDKGFDKSTFYATKSELGYTDSMDLLKAVDNGEVPLEKVTVKKHYGFMYNNKFYKSQNMFFNEMEKNKPQIFSKNDYIKLYNKKVVRNIQEYIIYRTEYPLEELPKEN